MNGNTHDINLYLLLPFFIQIEQLPLKVGDGKKMTTPFSIKNYPKRFINDHGVFFNPSNLFISIFGILGKNEVNV